MIRLIFLITAFTISILSYSQNVKGVYSGCFIPESDSLCSNAHEFSFLKLSRNGKFKQITSGRFDRFNLYEGTYVQEGDTIYLFSKCGDKVTLVIDSNDNLKGDIDSYYENCQVVYLRQKKIPFKF